MSLPIPDQSRSFWIDSTLESNYPVLTQDLSIDVAIVGAGLVGITAAYLLKKAGKNVAVIEAEKVGTGVSGHTTAKVTSLHRLKYAELIKEIGEEKARLYAESNQAALEKIAEIVQTESIDCDFERKSAYTFAPSSKEIDKISPKLKRQQNWVYQLLLYKKLDFLSRLLER